MRPDELRSVFVVWKRWRVVLNDACLLRPVDIRVARLVPTGSAGLHGEPPLCSACTGTLLELFQTPDGEFFASVALDVPLNGYTQLLIPQALILRLALPE